MAELSDAEVWGTAPAAVAARPSELSDADVFGPAAPAKKSGYGANLAAGVVEGSAGVANVLSDPFGNLIGKPLLTLGGTTYDAVAPSLGLPRMTPEQRADLYGDGGYTQPGTRAAEAVGRAIGAPATTDVVPADAGQTAVRAAVPAAIGMAALGGGQGIVRNALINPALGVAGAAGGAGAAYFAPDWLKPGAELAGNALGMVLPTAGINSLSKYVAPMFARRAPVVDPQTGQPVLDSAKQPITATPGQARAAAEQLQSSATDPAAVRATLENPPAPLMPGDQPTTAQLTGDPGLLAAAETASRTGNPVQQGAYRAQADRQNDLRVQTLQRQAATSDPAAFDTALKDRAASVDAATEAQVARARTQAAATAGALPGDLPAGSEGILGAALREPIAASNVAAKTREGALWKAIDPDGTLGVDMTPIKSGAAKIVKEMSPNEAPLAGNEAAIFATAANLPEVQSFRDLAALRTRLTDAIRAERGPQGDPQAVRRMSMLLDDVHASMEGSVNGQAIQDAHAVASGTKAEDASILARIQAWGDENRARATAAAVGAGDGSGQVSGGASGAGTQTDAGLAGTMRTPGQGPGGSQGVSGVQDNAPLVPNFDDAAQARYAAARQATQERAATFRNPPGVGEALQGGPQSGTFRTPDSAVPNLIVRVGPAGKDVATAYLKAGGDPAALSEAAAYSLRQAAMNPDGTLNPAKASAWMQKRSAFLSTTPELAAKFRDAASAQAAVDDAMATRATIAKQEQAGVIGKFLGDADPVARVWSIVNDKTNGQASMRQLADAVKGDPVATAGLQRAVAQAIENNTVGTARGATSEEAGLMNAKFQKFIRDAEPALREVMTPSQMRGILNVRDSLERDMRSGQVGAGSITGQVTAGRGSGLVGKIAGRVAGLIGAGSVGASIGAWLAGPVGAGIGSAAGLAIAEVVRESRQAGIKNIADLRTEALLNPALYRLLTAKLTDANQVSVLKGVAAQLRRASIVPAVQPRNDNTRETPRNALLH